MLDVDALSNGFDVALLDGIDAERDAPFAGDPSGLELNGGGVPLKEA